MLALAFLLLVLLLILVAIIRYDMHPFLALLGGAICYGFLVGMEGKAILASITEGFGAVMGNIGLLILFGVILGTFLEKTGAIAAIGYKTDIDWIQSTACDLFVLEALQTDSLDTKGIKRMHKKIITDYGNLHKILDLRVVINDKLHFSRQRK